MIKKQFLIWALSVSLCLASSPASSEETARKFLKHMLRISNPDKMLNSVLGRLERNRQQILGRQRAVSDKNCEEAPEILPEYTESLEESHERESRQLGVQKHYPICHFDKKTKKLNTNEYEYRPAYYEEIRCTSPNEDFEVRSEICSSSGFACVQWNKTIHLTRRRYSSDCWETRTLVIPAGCECMWPVHRLGDIKLHV